MAAVGVHCQFTDADDGVEVYLAVDVGVDFTGAAGLVLHFGLETDDVHIEDYEAGRAGVETLDDAEGLASSAEQWMNPSSARLGASYSPTDWAAAHASDVVM